MRLKPSSNLSLPMPNLIFKAGASLLLALLLILAASPASADMGPKPSMDFSIQFEIDEVELIEGKLLLCDDATCQTYTEFKGPFHCTANTCSSYALWGEAEEYVEYHRLELTFTDRTRESNVFTKQAHSARYRVLVMADHVEVYEDRLAAMFTPYMILCFTGAFLLTASIEAGVAILYLRLTKVKLQMLVWLILANFISLTLIWTMIAPLSEMGEVAFLILAESFAFVFEAAFLYLTGRRYGLNLRQAVTMSLLVNLASFSVGYWGWFFLSRA